MFSAYQFLTSARARFKGNIIIIRLGGLLDSVACRVTPSRLQALSFYAPEDKPDDLHGLGQS